MLRTRGVGYRVGDRKRVKKLCSSNQGDWEKLLTKGREKPLVAKRMQVSLETVSQW